MHVCTYSCIHIVLDCTLQAMVLLMPRICFHTSPKTLYQPNSPTAYETCRIIPWNMVMNTSLIFPFCAILQYWELKSFLRDDKEPFILHNLHHGCWGSDVKYWDISASSHWADGRLTVTSREASKQRDSGLDFSNRFEIWQAPRQLCLSNLGAMRSL